MAMSSSTPLPPGFRFHPTDEELILHYLKNRAASLPIPVSIIAEVDIYKFDPWELPAHATFGDREWYFFSPRDRKYPNGIRPNRAAASGYWKATGTDKTIHAGKGEESIGIKKALVFYKGRPPKGIKINWIMHEYRLKEAHNSNSYKPMKFRDTSMRLDDWVLCRIYKKDNHPQPIPALVDQEQEESSADDIYSVNFQNSPPERTTNGLQKSISISDFLVDYSAVSNFLDNPPELAAPEQHSTVIAHPNLSVMDPAVNSSSNGNKVQLGAKPEVVAVNTMKRQRLNDDSSFIYRAKFSNQFGSSQCSLLNQHFFDQKLINSQLGLD